MAIFDEPSRKPLPQPTFEDVKHAGGKALVGMIPFVGTAGAELIGVLSSPVAQRRDAWLEDLERRLRELEGRGNGFRFDDLAQNEQFVSATLHAAQAALRTHQTEKLSALRNAVLNVAIGRGPSDDLQLIFLNLINTLTPTHLLVLSQFDVRDLEVTRNFRVRQPQLTDLVMRHLLDSGLLKDNRPYAARNRDLPPGSLIEQSIEITDLGKQFLAFITAPEPLEA